VGTLLLLLLMPASASAESSVLAQLRAAAASSERAANSASLEGASAGNQVWAENAAAASPARTASGSEPSLPASGDALPAGAVAPKRTFRADVQAPPRPEESVPVPPKVRGWEGFKMGFLGTEAQALRLLSRTGKAAVPLMIVLQPIIAPIALVVGLLGIFGIRL
jgi:hypothetical protein